MTTHTLNAVAVVTSTPVASASASVRSNPKASLKDYADVKLMFRLCKSKGCLDFATHHAHFCDRCALTVRCFTEACRLLHETRNLKAY